MVLLRIRDKYQTCGANCRSDKRVQVITLGKMSNRVVGYAYDTRNRVSSITGNARTTTFSYDNAGRRTGVVWPNDTTAGYEL